MITAKQFAQYCDIGACLATTTQADIDFAIETAIKYQTKSIFTTKCHCAYAAEKLRGTGVNLEFSVCSPLGHDDIETKVFNTKRYVELGLTEVETFMNLSFFKSKMYDETFEDILAVRKATPEGMIMKCIIQTPVLTDEELRIASQMCVDAGVDFVKTGNGMFGYTTPHAVEVIANTVQGRANIKATGEFRNVDEIQTYVDLGATRFGIGTEQFLEFYNIIESREGK